MSLVFKLHDFSDHRAPGAAVQGERSRALLADPRHAGGSLEDPASASARLAYWVRTVMWSLVVSLVLVDLFATFLFRVV